MENSVLVTIAATVFFTVAATAAALWLWWAQSRKK